MIAHGARHQLLVRRLHRVVDEDQVGEAGADEVELLLGVAQPSVDLLLRLRKGEQLLPLLLLRIISY